MYSKKEICQKKITFVWLAFYSLFVRDDVFIWDFEEINEMENLTFDSSCSMRTGVFDKRKSEFILSRYYFTKDKKFWGYWSGGFWN